MSATDDLTPNEWLRGFTSVVTEQFPALQPSNANEATSGELMCFQARPYPPFLKQAWLACRFQPEIGPAADPNLLHNVARLVADLKPEYADQRDRICSQLRSTTNGFDVRDAPSGRYRIYVTTPQLPLVDTTQPVEEQRDAILAYGAACEQLRNWWQTQIPDLERLVGSAVDPGQRFLEIMRRYESEGVVFQSAKKDALYQVSAVDEDGCSVERLKATKEERCTTSIYLKRLEDVRKHGGRLPVTELSNTVAVFCTLAQGQELGLAPDRKHILDLSDTGKALHNFCEVLKRMRHGGSSAEPKIYKPAVIAAVVEAVDRGDLTENRISFGWLVPRCLAKLLELGQEATEKQVAYAFYHLTSELFWMLAYHDPRDFISDTPSPEQIKSKVRHATIKDTYWRLLRVPEYRTQILETLREAWWPDRGGTVSFWWVNQGKTYDKERSEGIIWAPQATADGKKQFHWDNVAQVTTGDIVFHYANGVLRALSCATGAAEPHPKPASFGEAGSWENDGWIVRLDYTDLAQPIPLEEVSEGMRKIGGKYTPINRTGGVNQGYLFQLNDELVRVIAEKLNLEALPSAIAKPLERLLADQWSTFIHWGRRFFARDGVQEGERKYKLEIAEKLTDVRRRLIQENEQWLDGLKRAFGSPNNLTFHISHSRFLDWCSENRQTAEGLLRGLWDQAVPADEALRQFLAHLPPEAVKGTGTRTNIASFLAMVRDPQALPVYKADPFDRGCRLTGFQSLPKEEAEVYPHALRFLDRILREAADRGLQLEDRLDSQSVLWCVTKYDPPEDWPEEERQALVSWRKGIGGPVIDPTNGLRALADKLLLDVSCLEEIERLLESKGQIIFYGPPGTGKTYVAREIARHYAGQSGVQIVQFHPSYTYEDLVEGYRPCLHANGQPGFEIVRGPLRLIAEQAREHPDNTYVLLIDEINRGNIAKVFGELYFLLEYREEDINLQYSRDVKFSLPRNLWIIGTMNTADRSIALIDAALRRRFYFYPFFPDEEPIGSLLRNWLEQNKPELSWVADIVEKANERLGDRHGAIGPSYFLRDDLDEAWVNTIWKHAVLPYLAEQFFGEEERLDDFQLGVLQRAVDQESQPAGEEDATD